MIKTLILSLLCFTSSWASWHVTGEWLYWKPSVQGALFGQADGRDLRIKPTYHSGYRVEAGYHFCNCLDITASGLQQGQQRTRHSHADITFDPVGATTGGAKASAKWEYSAFDIAVGATFVRRNCLVLRLFLGIDSASLKETNDFRYASGEIYVVKRRLTGTGPLIGIGARISLPCNVFVHGEVGIAALIGTRSLGDTRLLTAQGSFVQRYPGDNVTTPAYRARVGIGYSCFCVRAEIGYSLRHYPNAFIFTPRNGNAIDIFLEDVTYGGPYASLSLTF